MNATHAERLMMLASFLEKLPPERFNFRVWGTKTKLDDCGTVACAFGWATQIPAFAEMGLCLTRIDYQVCVAMKDDIAEVTDWDDAPTSCTFLHRAAERVFGLTEGQFTRVFTPDHEDSPPSDASAVEVAANIRKCVREWMGESLSVSATGDSK